MGFVTCVGVTLVDKWGNATNDSVRLDATMSRSPLDELASTTRTDPLFNDDGVAGMVAPVRSPASSYMGSFASAAAETEYADEEGVRDWALRLHVETLT